MKRTIEALGFRVIAVTNYKDGVQYDALTPIGQKRRLIHGEKKATSQEAMASLYSKVSNG